MGVCRNGVRLSVGIEDVEDLIEDLDQALTVAFSVPPYSGFALVQ